jgi:hypothetical protein
MFAKALLREHRPSKEENAYLMEQLRASIDRIMATTIGRKEEHIPKPDLRYDEYLAIKNEFSASQLEREDFRAVECVGYAHIILYMLGKVLRRAKML